MYNILFTRKRELVLNPLSKTEGLLSKKRLLKKFKFLSALGLRCLTSLTLEM